MTKTHFEKVLLIGAAGLWLIAGLWCWQRESLAPRPVDVGVLTKEDYPPTIPTAPSAGVRWNPPIAQPAGPTWIFEIFSAPLIQRDSGTGDFTAGEAQEKGADRLERGIQLLAVRPIPYRVQLQGGFEVAGGYVAAFAAVETQQVWCGRPGERWAEMDVILERMDPGNAVSPPGDPTSSSGHFAQAIVRDEKTGEQVTLVAGVPTLTSDLVAAIRFGNAKTLYLRKGDIWREGKSVYRVDRLRMNPGAVAEITRTEMDGDMSERLLLRPDEPRVSDPGAELRATVKPQGHSFSYGP